MIYAFIPFSKVTALDFYVDYSRELDISLLQAYDVIILNPQANINLQEVKNQSQAYYGYVSVGEIAADAPYREKAIQSKIRFLGINDVWKSALVDASQPEWQRFVTEVLAREVVDKGYDGFFLDTVDSVQLMAQKYPSRTSEFIEGMVQLIKTLAERYPGKKIIINRGFELWEKVQRQVHGMMVESMYQTQDIGNKQYKETPSEVQLSLINLSKKVQAAGLAVYVLDYVDPTNLPLARITAEKIEALGFHALISTPELDGTVLAPLQETPRFLLNLYGLESVSKEKQILWPADTFMALYAQMPLEWLGYEVDYLNPDTQELPGELGAKYAGVVVDRYMDIGISQAGKVVDWLILQKQRGKKIIFLGDLPFIENQQLSRLIKEFSLGGTFNPTPVASGLKAGIMSPRMNYEAKVILSPYKLNDLQAPQGPQTQVELSVEGLDASGNRRQYDAIFTTSWGGFAMEPYITFCRPDFIEFWLMDPFHFFDQALGKRSFPVPDHTTRDGLRLFFAHIDADGFIHQSTVEKGKRSSEVIYERVIQKYPLPVTASIIEAEIRGHSKEVPDSDVPKLMQIAKRIFNDPKVEAGSHTYSHPFYWDPNDKTAMFYESERVALKPQYMQPFDVHREVAGSVQFINDNLLPPGKKVEIMQWSGACRAYAKALKLTRELGIENINGGETTYSPKSPSITRAAPRCMPWANEIQVLSAWQNENVFREIIEIEGQPNRFFYGGYSRIIDGFINSDSPRRIKPINIYYHFYSGDNMMAFKTLTMLYDWASAQPLHSVTASQYAKIARDAHQTRVFSRSESEWIIINQGNLRTFRMNPSNNLLPDISQCRGVTGYNQQTNAMYVHTDGSQKMVLKFSAQPAAHLFLASSSAEIRFQELKADRCNFTTQDVRPAKVILKGTTSGRRYELIVNGSPSSGNADAQGAIIMNLPDKADVKLQLQ